MTCEAAIRATRRALPASKLTAFEVWERIGWWHPDTIAEALVILVERGDAEVFFSGPDSINRYRRKL